jgi:hypothetical protein
MKWGMMVLGVAVAVMAAPQFAAADVLVRPDWYPDPAGVFAGWELSEPPDQGSVAPTWCESSFGAQCVLTVGDGAQWVDTFEGRQGLLTGDILLAWLSNWPEPRDYKEIWLQIAYWPDPAAPAQTPVFVGSEPESTIVGQYTVDLGGGWFGELTVLIMVPNPDLETLAINPGNGYVDQIVVDTRCVPEPAGIAVLGAGLAVSLIRRRRSRSS